MVSWRALRYLTTPTSRERRHIENSVYLHIPVRPITYFLFCFGIGLPTLAHGCFAMKVRVANNHDRIRPWLWRQCQLNRGFDMFSWQPHMIWLVYHVGHMGLPPREDDNPDMMLTFDLRVKFIWFYGIGCVRTIVFFVH